MPKILLLGIHGSKIITQALTKNFLSLDMDDDFPFSKKIYNLQQETLLHNIFENLFDNMLAYTRRAIGL